MSRTPAVEGRTPTVTVGTRSLARIPWVARTAHPRRGVASRCAVRFCSRAAPARRRAREPGFRADPGTGTANPESAQGGAPLAGAPRREPRGARPHALRPRPCRLARSRRRFTSSPRPAAWTRKPWSGASRGGCSERCWTRASRVEVRGGTRTPAEPSFTIDAGDGEPRRSRKLDDAPADCDQLHSALALSIALAIDATLAERAQGTPPPPATDDDELLQEKPEPPYLRFAISLFGQAASNLVSTVGVAPRCQPAGRARPRAVPGFAGRRARFARGRSGVRLEQRQLLRRPPRGAARSLPCLGAAPAARAWAAGHGPRQLPHRRNDFSGDSRTEPHGFYAFSASFELQAEILSWLGVAANVELIAPFQNRSIVLLAADGKRPQPRNRSFESVGLLIGAGPVFRLF